jgi:hypothetical protein
MKQEGVAMKINEINEVYRKMGIGSQEERDRFLKWSPEMNSIQAQQTFIIESPNSELEQGDKNA